MLSDVLLRSRIAPLLQVAVKTERCPCGVGVCVQCHQLVPEDQFYTHRCPVAKTSQALDDAATIETMKRLGKKCPNCAMFIIKNAGCDIMMCGDKAHGDLRKAIKAGGCGQTFKWSDLSIIEDNITNFQGQRVKCNPTIKYAKEIAAEKKKLGILMSDEEMKVAELDLSTLEKEEKEGVATGTLCGFCLSLDDSHFSDSFLQSLISATPSIYAGRCWPGSTTSC